MPLGVPTGKFTFTADLTVHEIDRLKERDFTDGRPDFFEVLYWGICTKICEEQK